MAKLKIKGPRWWGIGLLLPGSTVAFPMRSQRVSAGPVRPRHLATAPEQLAFLQQTTRP